MKNLFYTAFIFSIILCTACEKVLIGDQPENNPEVNFELYWNDVNEHYGLLQARNYNWDSIYTKYRPMITTNTSEDELWNILIEAVDYLDDSHSWIFDRETSKLFTSGYTLNQAAHQIFRSNPYKENYLENYSYGVEERDPNKLVITAKVKDKDIGYIWLGAMDDYDEYLVEDFVIENQDRSAVIVDVRSNGGGDANIARLIASFFSDGEYFVNSTQDKIGPGPNDFAEPVEWYTSIGGAQQFTKPVIVLSNRACISAGEDFLLNMKKFDHVTQVGDTTAGDFSNTSMHRFLPNGWEYRYSTQLYLNSEGNVVDGIGLIPDVYAKNEQANIDAGEDVLIETALQYLFDTYGIE